MAEALSAHEEKSALAAALAAFAHARAGLLETVSPASTEQILRLSFQTKSRASHCHCPIRGRLCKSREPGLFQDRLRLSDPGSRAGRSGEVPGVSPPRVSL